MSIDYRLTLSGDIPLDEVAALAAPEAVETSTSRGERMLTAALYDERGYVVDITSGSSGYYDAEDDGALWVWEPDSYVDVDFHMRKDSLMDLGVPNMLAAVARVLNGRTEDAALVLNGNWLLLSRVNGSIHKSKAGEGYDERYGKVLPG
ncbi:SitI3 family protein [Plantactinospora sp. B5E13]|uniref:SitI3 family protein n=1 Tax=unclassified Plantactinospora TaxID=2631981 RepID=UPI00325EBF34